MLLNKFKAILENEKEQIIIKTQLAQTQELDCSGDEIDQIQSKILALTSSQLLERDQLKLKRIEMALKRINEGSFGSCLECGEEIGEKRLLVSPILNLCVGCAEDAEFKRKRVAH